MDPERYLPLCKACHIALDRPPKTHCVAGHAFTPENTYVRPNGVKNCKICRRANQREQRMRKPRKS